MKLKKRVKEWKNKIAQIFGDLQDSNPNELKKLGTILNYGITAFFLSFPLYIFSFIYYQPNTIRFILIMICLWTFLPFMEYYYIWFRERWKDDLHGK